MGCKNSRSQTGPPQSPQLVIYPVVITADSDIDLTQHELNDRTETKELTIGATKGIKPSESNLDLTQHEIRLQQNNPTNNQDRNTSIVKVYTLKICCSESIEPLL